MSVLMALGTGLKAGGQAVAQAAPIIGAVAGAKSVAGKTYRKDLHKRAGQLESGQLGLTPAQRRQMYMESMRAAETQGADPSVARSLAASGMTQANTASAQLAESRANAIRGDLKDHRDKVQRDWTAGAEAAGPMIESVGGAVQGAAKGGLSTKGVKSVNAGMPQAGTNAAGGVDAAPQLASAASGVA